MIRVRFAGNRLAGGAGSIRSGKGQIVLVGARTCGPPSAKSNPSCAKPTKALCSRRVELGEPGSSFNVVEKDLPAAEFVARGWFFVRSAEPIMLLPPGASGRPLGRLSA